jgi:hypothetical protein
MAGFVLLLFGLFAEAHQEVIRRSPHAAASHQPHDTVSRQPHPAGSHAKPARAPKHETAVHAKPPKATKH